jgi:hypothetical protein
MLIQQFIDAKVSPQLQVGPMVERISERVWDSSCPSQEFLVPWSVARAEPLLYSVGAHCPPFVMVTRNPEIEDVLEPSILANFARREMAMVVENWFRLGIIAVKLARSSGS